MKIPRLKIPRPFGRKRWIVLGVIALVVLGGGATAAAALSRDGRHPHPPAITAAPAVTVGQAADAALAEAPGVVHEVELKGPADDPVWEVEIFGADGFWHEVRVDAASGAILADDAVKPGEGRGKDRDHDRDDDRRGHHRD